MERQSCPDASERPLRQTGNAGVRHFEPLTSDRLALTWAGRRKDRLLVKGWSQAELGDLRSLQGAELERKLRVLPAELIAGNVADALPGMAGRYGFTPTGVTFSPSHPFLPGTTYALAVAGLGAWTIERPLPAACRTRALKIFPTSATLPSNALRLYIHFSAPMSEGWAARAVKVSSAGGMMLEGALLEMSPELWDAKRRRLTVLFEPGRVKRGLAPNIEAGTPLAEGEEVIVTVDSNFRDARGRPLVEGASRRYVVGPAVRRRVDPVAWTLNVPRAMTRRPLRVIFDRALDHGLLEHCLNVSGPEGKVAGKSAVGPEEESWVLSPAAPWEAGPHRLAIDPRLEDLAGNSLVRVFDRDLTRREDDPIEAIEFQVAFVPSNTPEP